MIDPDLEFLHKCNNEELDPLVKYITKADTNALDITDVYKKYYPNHVHYVDEIIRELQLFGGNTIANILRNNEGVAYKEIVQDVCKKLKVKIEEKDSVEEMEEKLLLKVFDDTIKKMSDSEKKTFEEVLQQAGVGKVDLSSGIPIGLILAQAGIRFSGFLAYEISVIVANAVARTVLGEGLSLAANATLTRSIAIFAGPIGWVITGLWTFIDIAGPAYRVTVPCVIHIAYLRQKKQRGYS